MFAPILALVNSVNLAKQVLCFTQGGVTLAGMQCGSTQNVIWAATPRE